MNQPSDTTKLEQARKRQRQLKSDGTALLNHLEILRILAKFGMVQSIGSYSYNLMQVPDLDFKIYCQSLDPSAIRQLGFQMANRSDVMGLRILDFTKDESSRHSGIYLNIFPTFRGELWKIDLLFLDAATKQPQHEELINRLQNLTEEERNSILLLKAELLGQSRYSHPTIFHNPLAFHGSDIYQAVLAGVRTVKDLELWKEKRD